MIIIIKLIKYYTIALIYYSDKFSRYIFRLIFSTFIVQLKVLPIREIYKFLVDLFKNNLNGNSILGKISIPLGINWNILCDTKPKKVYLLILTSTMLLYRGFKLTKNFILWPFKLGIFTFLFSVLGFDVTWFLSLFNIFYVNIPQWIYIQYILLYSNWLNWWYNVVDIKSLSSTSIFNNKPKEKLEPVEITDEPENTHNSYQFNRYFYSDPSGSNFNRFSLLENLNDLKSEGPPSPTGSNDSSETIKPNETVRDVVYKVYHKTRNNK